MDGVIGCERRRAKENEYELTVLSAIGDGDSLLGAKANYVISRQPPSYRYTRIDEWHRKP